MTQVHVKPSTLPPAESLIGTWRRFGNVGPVYEIIGIGNDRPAQDRTMRIRVLESREEVDYRLTDILEDPQAL